MKTQASTLESLISEALGRAPEDTHRTLIGRPGFRYANGNDQMPFKDAGAGNRIFLPDGNRTVPDLAGASSNNTIVMRELEMVNATINVRGSNNLIYIGASSKFQGRVDIAGDNNLFFFSDDSTCNRGNFVICGNGLSIIFGNDCMLSFDLTVRAGDSHAIFSLESLELISEPASILVGAHVWLCEGVTLLKGSSVGAGSVVGASSLVTGRLPDQCVAAGTPAKVLKERVSWCRHPLPAEFMRKRVRQQLGEIAAAPHC
jgi:acetyltransferase-like isoleucine patch superfamily enzyme